MQFKWTSALGMMAIAAATAIAGAQSSSTGTYLGVDVGAYFPINSTIRNVFGSTIPGVGISFANNNQPDKLTTSFNFGVIGANKNGNRFVAIPVTLGLGREYGGTGTSVRPFWRAGAGAAYLDYSIDANNSGNPIASHKIALTAVGEVGIMLSERVRLSASYNYFSKQDDF